MDQIFDCMLMEDFQSDVKSKSFTHLSFSGIKAWITCHAASITTLLGFFWFFSLILDHVL